jgi:8-oxo-dGTP pyrophosphatase MutT (NUDIX family)
VSGHESDDRAALKTRRIVTLFLFHEGRVLTLLRSQGVTTLRGRWAGISGKLERGETPRQAALREMEEEVGVPSGDVRLRADGDAVEIRDERRGLLWIVHPVLGTLSRPPALRLDWEHTAYRWVLPRDLSCLRVVPGLERSLDELLSRFQP